MMGVRVAFIRMAFALLPASLLVAHAAENAITVSVPHVFSYQVPGTWTVQTIKSATYPAATDFRHGEVAATITVEADHAPGPLKEWCQNSLAKNKAQFAQYNFSAGDLTPFVTTAGLNGFRATITISANSKNLSFVDYFFPGSSDAKIVVSCTSLYDDATHYAPIFDSAMKTFVPY
jgi:hypothetical protein